MLFSMLTSANIEMVNCVLLCFIFVTSYSVKEKKLYVSERINNWSLVSVLQYPLKVTIQMFLILYHCCLLVR